MCDSPKSGNHLSSNYERGRASDGCYRLSIRLSEGSIIFFPKNAPANQEPTIDRCVDGNHHPGKYQLDFSGQTGRIDDLQKIMLDETLCVAGLTRLDPKRVLQLRERATAAGQLNKERPSGYRDMH